MSDSGVASCLEARTGKRLWRKSLGGGHSASLVTAKGLVYFLSDKGVATVIRGGPTYAIVASNQLGENTYASPAFSGGQIFLRGAKHLYCIGAGAR